MYWGEGSTLGLLTFLGYFISMLGATMVWRGRDEASVWIHDEACAVRRSFSRYTALGPFYGPRSDSRLKAIPASFLATIRRVPRNPIAGGVILAFVGAILVLLDFFV